MSDGMWTYVNIDINDLKLAPIETWSEDFFDRETVAEQVADGKAPREVFTGIVTDWLEQELWDWGSVDVADWISAEGGSKYQVDDLDAFAEAVSTITGSEVNTREEWSGEGGPSVEENTWRAGVRSEVESTFNMQVPSNIHVLIDTLRAALDAGVIETWEGADRSRPIEDAARVLVDALKPIKQEENTHG